MTEPAGDDALTHLFWRDEILQAMYWMHGEGLGDLLTADSLARLLDAPAERLDEELCRLAEEEYVEALADAGYRLTALGREAGSQSFSDEFAGLTGSAHGACGPGCD